MPRPRILILPADKQRDVPITERRSRLFFGDGTEILGLASYWVHQQITPIVTLRFEDAEVIYLVEPPATQSHADDPGRLVARLREYFTEDENSYAIEHPICTEAADEIVRLRALLTAR